MKTYSVEYRYVINVTEAEIAQFEKNNPATCKYLHFDEVLQLVADAKRRHHSL